MRTAGSEKPEVPTALEDTRRVARPGDIDPVGKAEHRGLALSRRQLLDGVWGDDWVGDDRTVDVHVRRLRAKLGEEHAGLIQTVRSVGYRFGQSRWSS